MEFVADFAAIADAVAATGVFVGGAVDVVESVVFEGVAHGEPFVGEDDALGKEFFEFVLDGLLEFGEAAVVGEVEAMGGLEVFKFTSELLEVEIAFPILLFVLDEEDGAGVAEDLDAFEPKVVIGVFFTAIGDEEVEGAFGEEELVGLVVDFLAAKVPEVDAVGLAVLPGEFPFEDVDAFGGGVFGFGFESIVAIGWIVG